MTRLALAAVVGLSLILAACGDKAPKTAQAPAAAGGELNLYTARHYDADLKIYEAFTRKTGIKINRIELNPSQLIERMKAEGAGSPADVILMADAGALWRAQEAGLLQPVQSAVLQQRIPEQLREPEGRWFGFARRARVIAYDSAKVKPEEVASYEALAAPRFKGKVCARASDNIYNLSTLAAFIEHWGLDRAFNWARGIVANMARKPQGGDTDQIKAIGAGACEVALSNSYYYLRLVASDKPEDQALVSRVKIVFPEQDGLGTLVNISGGGVAANAPNKANAILFLEFLATDEVQSLFASANNEYPAVIGVAPPPTVAAYSQFKADPLPVSVYGKRQAEAQATFDRAGWP
ncbi:MAG: extracellular solute-binding protein [Caulobacter sp.]